MRTAGKSLVIAGDSQPAWVHALGPLHQPRAGQHRQDRSSYFPRADAGPADQTGSLGELVRDIEAGAVETLFILGGNPAYDAPADLDFARVLASDRTKLRIHLGLYDDETARLCHWHIPQAHCLEAWSDLRAFDGTVDDSAAADRSTVQGRSAHELLALLLGQPELSALEIVRDYWKRQGLPGDFEVAVARGARGGSDQGNGRKAQIRECRPKRLPEIAIGHGRPAPEAWKSSSGPTRRSGTADTPITAGFRNCPSRLRSCRGIAQPCSSPGDGAAAR